MENKLVTLSRILNVSTTLISGSLLDTTESRAITINSDRVDRLYDLIIAVQKWAPENNVSGFLLNFLLEPLTCIGNNTPLHAVIENDKAMLSKHNEMIQEYLIIP